MSLTSPEVGQLVIVTGGSIDARRSALAAKCSAALRENPSHYSYHFCIDEHAHADFIDLVTKKAGKKNAEYCIPRDVLATVQFLQRPRKELSSTLRTELAGFFEAADLSLSESLDDLVLTDPSGPQSTAYLAALAELGIDHPYLGLGDRHFAPSVKTVYVDEFDSLAEPLQTWFMGHLKSGISLCLSIRDVESCRLPDGIEITSALIRTNARHSTDAIVSSELEIEADSRAQMERLLDRFTHREVDAAYFSTHASRRNFESLCVSRHIPYTTDPVLSVMNTREIRALMAFLEWHTTEANAGLVTLLDLLGVPDGTWESFRARHKLSRKIATSCYQATFQEPPHPRMHGPCLCLSSLITKSRMASDDLEAINVFTIWHAETFTDHSQSLLADFVSTAISIMNPFTTKALKTAVYSALAMNEHDAPRICSARDVDQTQCSRAWLELPNAADCDLLEVPVVRSIRSRVINQLTISTVQ